MKKLVNTLKLLGLFLFSLCIYSYAQAQEMEESPSASYGCQSMIAPLVKVVVKRPDSAFAVADPLKWHYTSSPNLSVAQAEHDEFVKILLEKGIEVHYHDAYLPELADSIFVHDPVIITKKGAIVLRMGKALRRGEEEAIEKKLHSLGLPTFFKLDGDATAEGGDFLWLDEQTLAIGHSFRTNIEGIRQVRNAVADLGIKVVEVDLPHGDGEASCLHLQSLISLVDEKVALVFLPLLPVSFVKQLKESGFQLIEVPLIEFLTMGSNVLALSPGVCLTTQDNPITKKRLEEAGIEVITYKGDEISLKAEGGATCLTRPLLRRTQKLAK